MTYHYELSVEDLEKLLQMVDVVKTRSNCPPVVVAGTQVIGFLVRQGTIVVDLE